MHLIFTPMVLLHTCSECRLLRHGSFEGQRNECHCQKKYFYFYQAEGEGLNQKTSAQSNDDFSDHGHHGCQQPSNTPHYLDSHDNPLWHCLLWVFFCRNKIYSTAGSFPLDIFPQIKLLFLQKDNRQDRFYHPHFYLTIKSVNKDVFLQTSADYFKPAKFSYAPLKLSAVGGWKIEAAQIWYIRHALRNSSKYCHDTTVKLVPNSVVPPLSSSLFLSVFLFVSICQLLKTFCCHVWLELYLWERIIPFCKCVFKTNVPSNYLAGHLIWLGRRQREIEERRE